MAEARTGRDARQVQLLRMGDALHAAAAAADWALLDKHVSSLAPQLRALAAHGPWSPAERAAIARLRTAHDAAFQAASGASDELATRLEQLRNNKDGWIAYAINTEIESGTSHV